MKRFETPDDAVAFLVKNNVCQVDAKTRTITHDGANSLKVNGALDFLRKNGYTIQASSKVDNWNVYVKL